MGRLTDSAFATGKMASLPSALPSAGVVDDRVKRALMDIINKKTGMPEPGEMMGAEEMPSEPAPEAEALPRPIVLKEGQRLLSDILGKVLTRDLAVTVLKSEDIPEEVRHLVPTIDPTFQPDNTDLWILLNAWENADTVLVTGPTGCGKSQLMRHGAALTNRPFIRINMTEDAESSVIFGTLVARAGSTVWVDGPATEAVRYGAVLLIDEWDVTPPGVFMGFQWLLENNGKLFLKEMPGSAKDKILTPHPATRFVMCGNTVGQGDESGAFAGTAPQNTAGIDRFETTLKMRYMKPDAEEHMLFHVFEAQDVKLTSPVRTIEKMVAFANLCRQAYEQRSIQIPVSPRTLINWGHKMQQYDGDVRQALTVAYLNKLTNTQVKVVDEFVRKVFG